MEYTVLVCKDEEGGFLVIDLVLNPPFPRLIIDF